MISKKQKLMLHNRITIQQKADKIPGMALVVSQNGKIVYENYAGYRDIEKQLPVTKDTVFGVASITKSLVALAIMQLRDAGKLQIEDKVAKWIPELRLPDPDVTRQLEIRHLMSHTSGLPGMSLIHEARAKSILNDPDGEYLFGDIPYDKNREICNVDDLIKRISETDFTLLDSPGTVFNYSNEGYGLLQAIIEKASGMDFIPYMETYIFTPLEMDNAYFLHSDIEKLDNVAELYAYKKGKQKIFHSPVWWDVAHIYTNGSLKCSALDLLKYMDVYRLDGNVNGVQIVSEKSIQEMMTPFIHLPNGGSYGLGLEIEKLGNLNYFGHGGSIKGVSSNFKVVKEKDLTACLLINMADVPAGDILQSSIRTLLNLSDTRSVEKEVYPLPKEDLQKFVGLYQSEEGKEASITMKQDGLELQMEDTRTFIYPISDCNFQSKKGEHFHFVANEHEVAGVYIGKRMIPKVK